MQHILSRMVTSISDLKANPMQVIAAANGEPIAVLNRNKPAFYCMTPELFEAMIEHVDDMELARLANERMNDKQRSIAVKLRDL